MRIPKPNLPPVLKDVADAAAEIGGRTQNDSPHANGAPGSKTADALRKSRESSVGRLLSGAAGGGAVLPELPAALKAPAQALERSTSALLDAMKAGADPPKLDALLQRTIGTSHEALSAVMDHARSPRIANRDEVRDFMNEYGARIDEFQERIGEARNRPEMAVIGVVIAIVAVVASVVFAVCTWGSGAPLGPVVADAIGKGVGRSLEYGLTAMRNAKELLARSGGPGPASPDGKGGSVSRFAEVLGDQTAIMKTMLDANRETTRGVLRMMQQMLVAQQKMMEATTSL